MSRCLHILGFFWLMICGLIVKISAKPSTMINSSISMMYPGVGGGSGDYFSQWGHSDRSSSATCVDIPRTLKLCQGIGYNQMRLPNLLGHDTISEVVLQAKYWVALLNLECHADTQLFLCSLFSPVCLDRAIYPCRSLCLAVRNGCESRMAGYGYPWPDMVKCDKFPLDNDMCISVQTRLSGGDQCEFCNQAATYENILDNFCRSDFVVKSKLKKVKRSKVTFRKGKVLKLKTGLDRRKIRRPIFLAKNMNVSHCCKNFSSETSENFLVMGKKLNNDELIPTLIMPWQRQMSPFKQATRMFKKFDCSNPSKVISENIMEDGGIRIRQGGRKDVTKVKKVGGKKRQQSGEKKRKKDRKRKKAKRNRVRRRKNAKST